MRPVEALRLAPVVVNFLLHDGCSTEAASRLQHVAFYLRGPRRTRAAALALCDGFSLAFGRSLAFPLLLALVSPWIPRMMRGACRSECFGRKLPARSRLDWPLHVADRWKPSSISSATAIFCQFNEPSLYVGQRSLRACLRRGEPAASANTRYKLRSRNK